MCSVLPEEASKMGFEAFKDIPTLQAIQNNSDKAIFTKRDTGLTHEVLALVEQTAKVCLSL